MEGYIKYLVQAQCQPSPVGREEEIVRSLSQDFNVKECICDSNGLTLELWSSHPLADGAFKDLADLLIEALSEQNLCLRAGVINRVEKNRLSASVGAFGRELSGRIIGTRAGVFSFLAGASLQKIAGGVFGGTRLVPVMYFHRDVILDLMLTAKSRQLAMNPVAGGN